MHLTSPSRLSVSQNKVTKNTFAIFLKPLILRAQSAGKIQGFRKMASMLNE